jgi:hypothetical protein
LDAGSCRGVNPRARPGDIRRGEGPARASRGRGGPASLAVVTPVQERRRRRPAGPPETGWTLGAGGLPKVFWAVLGALLLALAIYLLAVGYIGYGAVIAILAVAAAVNLL